MGFHRYQLIFNCKIDLIETCNSNTITRLSRVMLYADIFKTCTKEEDDIIPVGFYGCHI